MIPLVDLRAQYLTIAPEINAAIGRVIEATAFVGGSEVKSFEAEFAAHCSADSGVPLHCASCGNGTDALYLALRALGIGEGDEVITVSHTFIATSEAISRSAMTARSTRVRAVKSGLRRRKAKVPPANPTRIVTIRPMES